MNIKLLITLQLFITFNSPLTAFHRQCIAVTKIHFKKSKCGNAVLFKHSLNRYLNCVWLISIMLNDRTVIYNNLTTGRRHVLSP